MSNKNDVKIAPSILSADFGRISDEVKAVETAGADMIHIDVMDGHFVPNITIGPLVVSAVRKATKLPLDVHLMIDNPDKYIEVFRKAGADIISFHAEAEKNLKQIVSRIKELGALPAVAINPATPAEIVFDILDDVYFVLVMSVNPGFEGQKFMPDVLSKIKQLRSKKSNLNIQVDGGINNLTAASAISAGANILVAGSAIYRSKDYKKTIEELRHVNRS